MTPPPLPAGDNLRWRTRRIRLEAARRTIRQLIPIPAVRSSMTRGSLVGEKNVFGVFESLVTGTSSPADESLHLAAEEAELFELEFGSLTQFVAIHVSLHFENVVYSFPEVKKNVRFAFFLGWGGGGAIAKLLRICFL